MSQLVSSYLINSSCICLQNVIPLPRQLEYFREYKTRLAAKFGQKRTMEIVNNALYIVSAGTNDFVVNYFTLPIQRHKYSLPSYMDFVMNKQLDFLEVCFYNPFFTA